MLRVRPDQIKALSAAQVIQADLRLVAYGRQRFPSEFEGHDQETMLTIVRRIRVAAAAYGIQKENDVATFLDFTVMYGDKFPEAAWASDILNCDALYGPDKMAVLRFRVRETGVNL